MRAAPVKYIEGDDKTHPPRAEIVTAKLIVSGRIVKLQYDADWGNGCWFDANNHAVAERAIDEWYPNVRQTAEAA